MESNAVGVLHPRYHVARQRGTLADTSREKVRSHITALLVNVGC